MVVAAAGHLGKGKLARQNLRLPAGHRSSWNKQVELGKRSLAIPGQLPCLPTDLEGGIFGKVFSRDTPSHIPNLFQEDVLPLLVPRPQYWS